MVLKENAFKSSSSFCGIESVLLIILHYVFSIKAPLRLRSCAYSVIPPPLDSEEKRMLDRFLRVDHAGEYGANRIYAGQMAVLGRSKTGPLIQVHPCFVSSTTALSLACELSLVPPIAVCINNVSE